MSNSKDPCDPGKSPARFAREGIAEFLRTQYDLSPQEARVAMLIAEGSTVSDTAASLGIAVSTARWHLKNIYYKLDIHRQSQLVRIVLTGFLDPA